MYIHLLAASWFLSPVCLILPILLSRLRPSLTLFGFLSLSFRSDCFKRICVCMKMMLYAFLAALASFYFHALIRTLFSNIYSSPST